MCERISIEVPTQEGEWIIARRANGEGSIYHRKDGRWVAQLRDQSGRFKYRFSKTKQGALEGLRELQSAVREGLAIPSRRLTVSAFAEQWIDTLEMTVRPSTRAHYAGLLRNHVIPHIGRMRLVSVEAVHIQAVQSRCAESGLSSTTVRHVNKVLKIMLGAAVKLGALSRNPALAVTTPRRSKKKPAVITGEELNRFIELTAYDYFQALWIFAATTGARVSEILALRWQDIDFDGQTASIQHTLAGIDGKWLLVEPKTTSSMRTVPLALRCVERLRNHRSQQLEMAMELGPYWQNNLDLVFVSESGAPIHRGRISKGFKQLGAKSGLPTHMTFHDLRHSAASLLLNEGVPVPLVSRLLGHSSPAITFEIYSHVIPNTDRQVADKMESLLA